jgi:phosphatidylserine/phosphatidylglycerophosphate/cardiolipin synthase-like enzyme
MFLNVKRGFSDTSTERELLARFAHRFRTSIGPWIGLCLRSIMIHDRWRRMPDKRRFSHAKCVVVDGRTAFVTSANFTEAAQERNIEVGILVRSQIVAERLIAFFDALIAYGAAKRAL